MRPLSESTSRVAGKALGQKYIALGRILNQWTEIVGNDLSDKAVPIKIVNSRGINKGNPQATLHVATTSAHSTTLHYQKNLILERINRIFGNNWITDIKFVPFVENMPSTPEMKKIPKPLTIEKQKYLTEVLEEVEDIEIKEKLKNLGKAILEKAKI